MHFDLSLLRRLSDPRAPVPPCQPELPTLPVPRPDPTQAPTLPSLPALRLRPAPRR